MPWWNEDREKFVEVEIRSLKTRKIKAWRLKGYETKEAEGLLAQAEEIFQQGEPNKALKILAEVNHALRYAPYVGHEGFQEPADLEEIIAASPGPKAEFPSFDIDSDAYYDRTYGGWLGKCIGGAFGMPVEGWKYERIKAEYGELQDYIGKPSTVNDDTAYEILLIHALEEFGPLFGANTLEEASRILALEWVEHLPRAFTAERVAIDNLLKGYVPPESGTYDNPYSEWIGAQMKGEAPGFIAPAHLELARTYAYIDGIIAHERNGVYGEIYDAVLVAAGYVESDVRKLIELGLEYVPERSRLARVVTDTLEICDGSKDWETAREKLASSWIYEYHQVHTFPNLANVITGLIFGQGDFERALAITNMCGLDTDCTVGQTGGIMGVILGARAIPAKWKDPIEDRLDSFVIGMEHLKISDFSRRTCEVGKKCMAQGLTPGPQ
jgi:ADP-ribosylglycohydrolase